MKETYADKLRRLADVIDPNLNVVTRKDGMAVIGEMLEISGRLIFDPTNGREE